MYKLKHAGCRIAAPQKVRFVGEESPGFKETRYQITSGWSNPSESATEIYRFSNTFAKVRLKGRGKSPPHGQ